VQPNPMRIMATRPIASSINWLIWLVENARCVDVLSEVQLDDPPTWFGSNGARIPSIPLLASGWLKAVEVTNMQAKDTSIQKSPCSSPLPELEVPMINTMVACLGVEHGKFNGLNVQLAYAATRLANGACGAEASHKILRVWDEIR
jgi:Hemerythrin HHE cation binding domain